MMLLSIILACIFASSKSFHQHLRPFVRARTLSRNTLFSESDGLSDTERFDDDDEGEEVEERPYGNRSLFWTNKYRKLLPYEKTRDSVLAMGFTCKEEWDEYVANGKRAHGPYLPNRPDEMYASDWVSWDEWLGIMRSYEETRNIVQHVLQLDTFDAYVQFVEHDPKRAERLRIPYRPDIVYREQGWDLHDFFGSLQ